MLNYKGYEITESHTSPLTGRECSTVQGYQFMGDGWAKTESEAKAKIDGLLDDYKKGELSKIGRRMVEAFAA